MLSGFSQYGQAIAFAGAILAAIGVALSSIHENRLQSKLITAQTETLRQVTGEGGFCFVIPQINIADHRDRIPVALALLNNSDYPVFGVIVNIMQRVPMGEGIDGSDGIPLFRGTLGEIYPNTGPQPIGAQVTLRRDRDNVFSILLLTRSGTFSEKLVITWDGQEWHKDHELRNLSEGIRGTSDEIIHSIREDFPYRQAEQDSVH